MIMVKASAASHGLWIVGALKDQVHVINLAVPKKPQMEICLIPQIWSKEKLDGKKGKGITWEEFVKWKPIHLNAVKTSYDWPLDAEADFQNKKFPQEKQLQEIVTMAKTAMKDMKAGKRENQIVVKMMKELRKMQNKAAAGKKKAMTAGKTVAKKPAVAAPAAPAIKKKAMKAMKK